MPRIENWSIISQASSPYQAPELSIQKIQGNVYGDEVGRFKDSDPILSSVLTEINLQKGYVQTKNTKYELGAINPVFEKWIRNNNLMTKELEEFLQRKKQ